MNRLRSAFIRGFFLLAPISLTLPAAPDLQAQATGAARPSAYSLTTETTIYPLRKLGSGVYAVVGDTGKGSEGRPNAGFIATPGGVVAVGGLASPAQARAVLRTIRSVTSSPIRDLVLYAHHPDMMFGAVEFKRAGATIVAHPNTQVLAGERGPDAMVADWDAVVGLQELLGFEYANVPDRPVTGTDTIRLGQTQVVVIHPGTAHSEGDLMVWVPSQRVLFAGDLLVADGVPMVVDGTSAGLLQALAQIEALHPRVVVPGHGAIPADPRPLIQRTRDYLTDLQRTMRSAVEQGTDLRRALAELPPPDDGQPVSLNSRKRRNAVRVYLEMERAVMGFDQ